MAMRAQTKKTTLSTDVLLFSRREGRAAGRRHRHDDVDMQWCWRHGPSAHCPCFGTSFAFSMFVQSKLINLY